jgi:hypothetical protein
VVKVLVNFLLIRDMEPLGYGLVVVVNVLLLWICFDGGYKAIP